MSDQRAAYDRLIAPHERWVRRYVRRLVPDVEDASDAAQEVLITAYRKVDPRRTPAEAFCWLRTVTRSVSHRHATRGTGHRATWEHRVEAEDLDQPRCSLSAEDAFLLAESWGLMLDVIDSLPSRYRQPLCLRYMDGLAYEDISAHLGLDHPQVAERLRTGRQKLREALAQRWEGRWPPGTECQWVNERLGRYVEGDLRLQQIVKLEEHADECPDCEARLAAAYSPDEIGPKLEAWAAGLRQEPPGAEAETQARRASESWPAPRCLQAMERIAARLAGQPDDFGWLALRGIFATSAFELPNLDAVDTGERLVALWPQRSLSWLTLANAVDVWPHEGAPLQTAMIAGGVEGVAGSGPEPACQALGDLGIHRLFEGALAEAEAMGRSALDLCPDDAWGWIVVAGAHAAQGRVEPALTAARHALRSARRRASLYVALCGRICPYDHPWDPPSVIHLAQQAVALAPRRPLMWNGLAWAYARAGMLAQAVDAYWRGLGRLATPQLLDLASAGATLLGLSHAVGGSATRVAEYVFHNTHRSRLAHAGIDEVWTDEVRSCIDYVMGRLFSHVGQHTPALECFAKAGRGALSPEMEWIREEVTAITSQRLAQ